MVPNGSLRRLLLGLHVFLEGINFLGNVWNLCRQHETSQQTNNRLVSTNMVGWSGV